MQLATPVRIGNLPLQHRIVMAPLTRFRADDNHTPGDIAREYYGQRASTPGTLLVTEGTFITARAGGYDNIPGIWNEAQIAQWKTITDAVHAKGSYIFVQLWALGRAAKPDVLAKDGYTVVSSGDLPIPDGGALPRPLSEEEIKDWVKDYAVAAKNAIAAGFDGVEIHGANGYLPDQFLQDTSNNRTDGYGGSVANRARFGLEVAKAVVNAIGAERTGYRISPWSTFQGMRMKDSKLKAQFTYLAENLRPLGLAYLHIVQARIAGPNGSPEDDEEDETFVLDAYGRENAVILAGGFTPESAEKFVSKHAGDRVAVAFGRYFISNPDLPFRLARNVDLQAYNRDTFYIPKSPVGYIDYPFSKEFVAEQAVKA